MALVIDETTLYALLGGLIIMAKIIGSQGGGKIVMWRLLGIRWFMRTEIAADGNALRVPLKMKIVKTHSLPTYNYKGKIWFTGGPNQTARVYGAPNWVYVYNSADPLVLSYGQYKDGKWSAVEAIDPALVHSAFENKSIEAFNGLNRKPDKFRWGMFGFAIFLIVILGIISVYYSYYYGINANCALHSRACPVSP